MNEMLYLYTSITWCLGAAKSWVEELEQIQ